MEIHRLHDMLTEAGIEHTFTDRTPPGWDKFVKDFSEGKRNWGWQVCVYDPNGEQLISAIEGYGTYGYDNWIDPENPGDLIEIMGLLTPEEEAMGDSVVGYLTAEDVFGRIVRALSENKL